MSAVLHVGTYILAGFGLLVIVLMIVDGCRNRAKRAVSSRGGLAWPQQADTRQVPLRITNLRYVNREEPRALRGTKQISEPTRRSLSR